MRTKLKAYLSISLFILTGCGKAQSSSDKPLKLDSPQGYFLGERISKDPGGNSYPVLFAYRFGEESAFNSSALDTKTGKYHKVQMYGNVSAKNGTSLEVEFHTYQDECGVDPWWRKQYGAFSVRDGVLHLRNKPIASRVDEKAYFEFIQSLEKHPSISCATGCESWNDRCIP